MVPWVFIANQIGGEIVTHDNMPKASKVWTWLKPWVAILAGIGLSAILLILSMPLGEQHFLAWFALVPILATTRGKGFLVGFVAGLFVILAMTALAVSGVFYKNQSPEGNVAWIITGCGIFGFAIALATAVSADPKLGKKPIWWLASLAVLFEAVLLLELPGHMALTQYRHGLSLGIASIGGVWLLTFLVWLCNIVLSRLDVKRQLTGCAGIALLAFATSGLRPHSPLKGTVALIQSVPEEERKILQFHQEAARQGALLAVWPEFGGIMFDKQGDTQGLKDASKAIPLVTSWPDQSLPKPFNTAALFERGRESQNYRKRKLFGAENKQHQPGHDTVSVPFGGEKVGLNICFDSCFPHVIRDTARVSDFIALPTIDPESPHGFLAAMHAAYTPIRSAETGVAIFRADGYAYSMATDGFGNIVAEAGIGPGFTLAPKPTYNHKRPIAMLIGDAGLWLCAGAFIFGLIPRKRPI